MRIKRWLSGLLCFCIVASSCTTLRRVSLPAEPQPTPASMIKAGDTVVVTLRDGTTHRVKVDVVEPDSITGRPASTAQSLRYPFAQMQSLQKRSVSFQTVGATLAVVALTGLGVVVAAMFGAF
jgi:hypothetical protein